MEQRPRGDLWLRVNYWTLANLSLLRKWWVIILLGGTIFTVVFALTNGAIYALSMSPESRLIASLAQSPINYAALRAANVPVDLTVGTPTVIPAAGTTSDIAVKVSNKNESWEATTFVVTFLVEGQEIATAKGLLLPRQENYVAAYGQSMLQGQQRLTGKRVIATIQDVEWVRSPGEGTSLESIFTVAPADYVRVEQTKPVRTVGTVTTTVTNESLDGFWEVAFTVTLFRSGTLVGINRVVVDRFAARTTRTISVQWSPAPAAVDTVRVTSELDILDSAIRMP